VPYTAVHISTVKFAKCGQSGTPVGPKVMWRHSIIYATAAVIIGRRLHSLNSI